MTLPLLLAIAGLKYKKFFLVLLVASAAVAPPPSKREKRRDGIRLVLVYSSKEDQLELLM